MEIVANYIGLNRTVRAAYSLIFKILCNIRIIPRPSSKLLQDALIANQIRFREV